MNEVKPPRRVNPLGLGPGRALVVFLGFYAIQLLVGVIVGVVGAAWIIAAGREKTGIGGVQAGLLLPATFISPVAGAVFAFRMTRQVLPGPLPGAFQAIGWTVASVRAVLIAIGGGLGLATVQLLRIVSRHDVVTHTVTSLTNLQLAGGWQRLLWAILTILVTPPVEEFLFRGVLLAGLCRDWDVVKAGATVTLLFTMVHVGAVGVEPVPLLAIGVLSVGALISRVTTGSLIPAIALHSAYNLGVTAPVYWGLLK